MPLAPLDQSHGEVQSEDDPDDRNRQVDRPLQFGVLLALRDPQRQGDRGGNNDQLPTPEVNRTEEVTPHPGLAESLGRIIDRGKDGVSRKGKDRRIGVQRTKPPEGKIRQAKRCPRQDQQYRHDQPDKKSHDSPNQGRRGKHSHNLVVVGKRLQNNGTRLSASRGGMSRFSDYHL